MNALLPEIESILKCNSFTPDYHYQLNKHAHEVMNDFFDLRKIAQECVENCKYIHSQQVNHEKMVWDIYYKKWNKAYGITNLQMMELKGLFEQWTTEPQA